MLRHSDVQYILDMVGSDWKREQLCCSNQLDLEVQAMAGEEAEDEATVDPSSDDSVWSVQGENNCRGTFEPPPVSLCFL